ncbi:Piso0_000658 [Millerozyma farinosa CBS 7064]|uniref:Small ribosomal subunit protein uS5m n=1 Tax=Pichia sorbitophila (strain ATCC MYA-4447 / BCRC 22081 / CBS 7064 / NBRC 10061 / NRRL Y-12695) TaxID=559304 RepID=G8YR58_PICSO|nr:Piso0_000658 [Millerozyma farinosa CBS 7064]
MIKTGLYKARVISAFKWARPFSTSRAALNKDKRINEHLEFLSKYYSPELLQSIKITEGYVSPNEVFRLQTKGDRVKSAVPPSDIVSDYSTSDPKWSEPIIYPNQGKGRSPYARIPQVQSPDRSDLVLTFKAEESERRNTSVVKGRREIAEGLAKLTGLDQRYISNLYVRPIVMKRVSCQTSKGKIPNFYALTVVGDRNGMVGLGEGKSRDGMRTALVKAHWNAVKNLNTIPRYENRTIIGDVEYKYHAVKLFLKSAPAGFGLRVNPNIFEVCQAAGIKDLSGKVYKSRNPMNVTKAFVEALMKQKPLEELAAGRGKKLVDLRRVYYSA